MAFNSLHFIIFYICVIAVYFSISFKWRWIFLLSASYYFYMCWEVKYIALIIASTLITYSAGLCMGKTSSAKRKKLYLAINIASNLAILIFYKYFDFINESIYLIAERFNIFYAVPKFNVLLPVGISFYTFQSLSYTIDVYRGEMKPERHIGIYALYVSFFPQLVAGPIERSTRLLPQFYQKHSFNYERTVSGLKLICWGFFKKLVIADRLAVIVDHIYSNATNYIGLPLIFAAVFFAYQVYCDFSGYSDIAIGSARIMGYDLMTNFNRPFASRTVAEIWRRWHISLYSWFMDYVYIPLGGSRVGRFRRYCNIMITFTISGLWHGAAWTFVLFGSVQAVFIIFAQLTQNIRNRFCRFIGLVNIPKVHAVLQVVTTFSAFVSSLILFRSANLSDALYIITHLHFDIGDFFINITNTGYVKSIFGLLGVQQNEIIISFVAIAVLELVQYLLRDQKRISQLESQPIAVRWAGYYLLVASILFFGAFNSNQGFIYFQF